MVVDYRWYCSGFVFGTCGVCGIVIFAAGVVEIDESKVYRGTPLTAAFGLLAQWLERHSYKVCVPGSIPG